MVERAIEAVGLVMEYKKGPRAVDGIELEVAPGEIYGFLGPNGAGKSTTVHILTTLLPPTAGTARVAGFDVAKEGPKVRTQIGAALQEAALDGLLTGREHLRLQATLQNMPRAERKPRADELLARVGLTQAADRKVRGYSGGMKRRLDLAMALVHRPRVLFLDEPTTGLDVQSRTALWEEVEHLAKNDGVTVFLTTQYLEEADVLADRVGIIDHGKIVAEGTPGALKAEIGRPTIEAVPVKKDDLGADGVGARALRRAVRVGPRRGRSGGARRLGARRHRPRARRRGDRGRAARAAPAFARRRLPGEDRPLARGRRRARGRGARGRGGRVNASSEQALLLARRSVVRTARQPANVVFPLVFPLLLLAVNSGGLDSATNLPGFPTHSFVAFALAIPFIQGALFATMNAGTDLARDIQTGFLNRLSLTPMRAPVLLVGQLGGIAVMGIIQALVYIVVGLIAGVRFESGPLGIGVLLLFAVIVSIGFGALGAFAALRTGSARPCRASSRSSSSSCSSRR